MQGVGEGNGTPLQHSCLENCMDGRAWWTAVHGVAKSRTTQQLHFSLLTFMHCRRKWQPTPVFLPGESQGQGSLVGCRLWGRTESDTTERLSNSGSARSQGQNKPSLWKMKQWYKESPAHLERQIKENIFYIWNWENPERRGEGIK